jgi:hypothetical protein
MSYGVASRHCLCSGHRCTSTIGGAGAAPLPAAPPRGVASGAHPLTLLTSLGTTAKACSHRVSFSPHTAGSAATHSRFWRSAWVHPPAPAWERISATHRATSPAGVGPLPSAGLLGLHQSFCVLCFLCTRRSKRRLGGSLASRPVPAAALRLAVPGHEPGCNPGAGRAHTGACQRPGGPLLGRVQAQVVCGPAGLLTSVAGTTRAREKAHARAWQGWRGLACRGVALILRTIASAFSTRA